MDGIVIIGNGIAGITAARHIRKKSDQRIIVISAESKYFFSRTALMYVYMGHMKFEHTQPYENWFWKKNRIELIQDTVVGIDTKGNAVRLKSGATIPYHKLILAMGSKPNDLTVPGANLLGVQPLYSKQHLELLEQQSNKVKQAVIVGGGLIGIELAEMLHSRGITVHMIVRETSFWNNFLPSEESAMINRHIAKQHVHLHLNRAVKSINGEQQVESVTLDDNTVLNADLVGVTIGVSPNIALIADSNIEVNRGILVDEYLQTNLPNIYAIGDCAELKLPPKGRRAIEPVWYTGRTMGETVAETITGQSNLYAPGIWFNSAKFFDIEYQTYGYVPNVADTDHNSFYWEDAARERALRIVYTKAGKVVGINSLGIRLRHEVADTWISEGINFENALKRLNELNFDQEFIRKFEKEITRTHSAL